MQVGCLSPGSCLSQGGAQPIGRHPPNIVDHAIDQHDGNFLAVTLKQRRIIQN